MPELPEVQTVLSTLEHLIQGKQIKSIEVLSADVVLMDAAEFEQRLMGKHFQSFKRRGKYLIFEMEDVALVSHLRMEGKYFVEKTEDPVRKHTHVLFHFTDGTDLRYNDVRRFGRMELMEKQSDYNDFHGLGPEPFSEQFTAQYAYSCAKKSKRSIKMMLLDQSFVAGIGNIYADEICFRSKIRPESKACRISKARWETIIQSAHDVLSAAIDAGGSTVRSYTSSLGVTGRFQLCIDVYGRENEPCHICGTPIKKIVHGQRGTHFCPVCQRRIS